MDFKEWLKQRISHEQNMREHYLQVKNIQALEKQDVYIQALEECQVKFDQMSGQ